MADEPEPNVIRLVPRGELEAQHQAELDQEMRDACTREALEMLERAAGLVREHGAEGLAIAFVLQDGSYGRLTPTLATNTPGLIGAVGTLHHDLILRSLHPPTTDD